MWRDPHEVLNQNGDSHVLTLMPFPTPSHTVNKLKSNSSWSESFGIFVFSREMTHSVHSNKHYELQRLWLIYQNNKIYLFHNFRTGIRLMLLLLSTLSTPTCPTINFILASCMSCAQCLTRWPISHGNRLFLLRGNAQIEMFSRAGPRGRGREWATLGVHPLSWLLSNNRLEKVPFASVLHTSSNRLLLSNQDKGCTPSVAHSLPLPLGPALLNLWSMLAPGGGVLSTKVYPGRAAEMDVKISLLV